jgi:hypothetical protein
MLVHRVACDITCWITDEHTLFSRPPNVLAAAAVSCSCALPSHLPAQSHLAVFHAHDDNPCAVAVTFAQALACYSPLLQRSAHTRDPGA